MEQALAKRVKRVVNELPWDNVVTSLNNPKTTKQAIIEADLNWEVVKRPIVMQASEKHIINCPDRFALTRQDMLKSNDAPIFGVVKKKYVPLQNSEAFEFFDGVLKLKEASISAAGSFDYGRIIYILAKLPGHIKVLAHDVMEKYLLITNTHDGKQSVIIKFIPYRIVCTNQLTSASLDGSSLRAIHSKGVSERIASAKELLGIINTNFKRIEDNFKFMVTRKLKQEEAFKYITRIFNPNVDKPKNQSLIRASAPSFNNKGIEMCKELLITGAGNNHKQIQGTLWAAYNAVTEYIDHHTKQRSPENMLKSNWVGAGDIIKRKAYTEALNLINFSKN